MDELIAFLTARLDDDELAARAATEGPWHWAHTLGKAKLTLQGERGATVVPSALADVYPSKYDAEHIVRHDPARVLADVAAKREIVKRADWAWAGVFEGAARGKLERAALYRRVLGYLAQPYADHPDFRKEWVLR